MAVELETLEIKIEASAGGAAKSLDKLSESLQNAKRAISGLSGKEKNVENLDAAGKKAASGISDAEHATEELKEQQNR